jgi:TonB-dependent SusC/RagA subfamily outer membrane receptor
VQFNYYPNPKIMETLSKMFAVYLILCVSGCASSERASQSNEQHLKTEEAKKAERPDDNIVDKKRTAHDLTDYLTRVPGVYVRGAGNNVKVTIRGSSSLLMSNEPLYVLDGNIIGREYYRIKSRVNVNEIKSIRVLRGTDAAIYGFQGANGVILIRTKGYGNKPLLDKE